MRHERDPSAGSRVDDAIGEEAEPSASGEERREPPAPPSGGDSHEAPPSAGTRVDDSLGG
jgi:hypothetical protein